MHAARLRNILLATSILAFGTVGFAHAQVGGEEQVEEIVVTGSRIVRPGFTAPTPVSTVTAQELERRAPTNISELQADIPQLRPNLNTNGNRTSGGGSSLDLRGLGPTRTLLLLDGRRMPVSNPSGLQDTTAIPALLIQRIDIVTGGASAAYGSDAVSGVVNIILDNKLQGFKSNLQMGQSRYGDYQNYDIAAAFGTAFGPEDRGHIVVSADVFKNLGIQVTDPNERSKREWNRNRVNFITNPAYVAGSNNGQTRLVTVSDARFSRMTDGGVIVDRAVGDPLRGIMFGPGGVQQQFQFGNYIGTTYQQGGNGGSYAERINMFAHQERKNVYGHASYALSDNVNAWAEGFYSDTFLTFAVVPNYNNGDITIQRDNAFLPTNIRNIMVANNIANFRMGRTNEDARNLDSSDNSHTPVFTYVKTSRFGGGFDGTFGGSWTWNVSAEFAHNKYDQGMNNDRINANWLRSIDSVVDPATGTPVCRATLSADPAVRSAAAGCVPVNLFGTDSISQAAAAYSFGTSRYLATNSQQIYTAGASGEPFELWAGPVSVAAGVEYRHEEVLGVPDAISQASGWRTNNFGRLEGEVNVKEAYAETVIPLLKDSSMGQSLEFNAAGRITDYSTSGTVETWKVGLSYVPVEDVRLRGTISRDIRAANLAELFTTRSQGIGNIIDQARNSQLAVLSVGGGNPDLEPEKGDTWTVGAVYRPTWLPGFQASVDYYSINLKDAIGSISSQQTADNCFAGQQIFCDRITRNPQGLITEVRNFNINFQEQSTSGVDLEAVYNFGVASLPGRFSLRYNAAYVHDRVTVASGVTLNSIGDVTGSVPHWRMNFSAGYDVDKFSVQTAFRYIGKGLQNYQWVDGIDIPAGENDVPAQLYLDMTVTYQIVKGVRGFVKVDNVFDNDPPLTPGTAIGNEQAASNLYDRIGRNFAIGLRMQF
jgi:outer membrane receptor protein involved in Fe transport